MNIVSDDTRLINELHIFLNNKDIEVEKIEQKSRELTDKRPMDGLLKTFLEIVVNTTTIAVNLTILNDYLKQNYPHLIMIFESDTLNMSMDEYMSMSDDGRRAVEENYNVLIKKK